MSSPVAMLDRMSSTTVATSGAMPAGAVATAALSSGSSATTWAAVAAATSSVVAVAMSTSGPRANMVSAATNASQNDCVPASIGGTVVVGGWVLGAGWELSVVGAPDAFAASVPVGWVSDAVVRVGVSVSVDGSVVAGSEVFVGDCASDVEPDSLSVLDEPASAAAPSEVPVSSPTALALPSLPSLPSSRQAAPNIAIAVTRAPMAMTCGRPRDAQDIRLAAATTSVDVYD